MNPYTLNYQQKRNQIQSSSKFWSTTGTRLKRNDTSKSNLNAEMSSTARFNQKKKHHSKQSSAKYNSAISDRRPNSIRNTAGGYRDVDNLELNLIN